MLTDLCKTPIVMTINDKKFEVSPLTQADFAAILSHIQFEPFNTAKDQGASQEILDKLFMDCSTKPVDPSAPEFDRAMKAVSGQLETVFLSLRHKHPTITREELRNFDYGDSLITFNVVMSISGMFPLSKKENVKNMLETYRTEFPTLFAG
jgi:hypothetical protein